MRVRHRDWLLTWRILREHHRQMRQMLVPKQARWGIGQRRKSRWDRDAHVALQRAAAGESHQIVRMSVQSPDAQRSALNRTSRVWRINRSTTIERQGPRDIVPAGEARAAISWRLTSSAEPPTR